MSSSAYESGAEIPDTRALVEAAQEVSSKPSAREAQAYLDGAIRSIAQHSSSIGDPGQAALFHAMLGLLVASKTNVQAISECQHAIAALTPRLPGPPPAPSSA